MSKIDLGVALVTGASGGIGQATAQALKRAAYRVFGTSRSVRPSMEVHMRNGVAEVDALEVVAATVVKAATAATPRRRYAAAGRLARQVRIMRRLVRESAFDKSLRKHNHLAV